MAKKRNKRVAKTLIARFQVQNQAKVPQNQTQIRMAQKILKI